MSFAFWKSSNSASSVPETKTKPKSEPKKDKENDSSSGYTTPHQGMGGYSGKGDAERKKYIDSLTDN